MEGYQWGGGRMREKVQGIRNIIGRYKIDRRRLSSIGNREAKVVIFTTHGRELKGGCWREWGYQLEGAKQKKWDNCDCVINKI